MADAGISPALSLSSRLRGILAGVAGRDCVDFLQQRRQPGFVDPEHRQFGHRVGQIVSAAAEFALCRGDDGGLLGGGQGTGILRIGLFDDE